jgi:CRISPR-associated protein Cmr2
MPTLFITTLGPVQDFISTARKSRDLWFGSWVLSELSKAVAKTLHDLGFTLVFPNPEHPGMELQPDTALNVVNRIVAYRDIDVEITPVGAAIQQAVTERLTAIWQQVEHEIGDPTWQNSDRAKVAQTQIEDVVEIYWAGGHYLDNGYIDCYKNVNSVLAARKMTRAFKPVMWGDTVPKSSLDGQRESVIAEKYYPRFHQDDAKEQKRKIEHLYQWYKAGGAERLSGVDLLKRHGKRGADSAFASTSHVAAGPVLKFMQTATRQPISKRAWEKYFGVLKDVADNRRLSDQRTQHRQRDQVIDNYDGGLLYESRLHELFEAELDPSKNNGAQAKYQTAITALRQFLKESGVGDPSPYYAILLADGDNMGKAIDACASAEEQQQISAKLSTFAKDVQKIVETDNQGELIYAGGDDVLALVPLHTVVQCAAVLAKDFQEAMQDFKSKEGIAPTLSAGIAITHHIEPLSNALDLARAAEQRAKRIEGKAALCITVSKRSGADTTIAGKWDVMKARLERLTTALADGSLPDGIAFEYQDLWARVGALDHGKAIFAAEAKRIFARKVAANGNSVDQTLRDEILGWLQSDGKPQSVEGWQAGDLVNAIIVARLFATAKALAERGGKQYDMVAD